MIGLMMLSKNNSTAITNQAMAIGEVVAMTDQTEELRRAEIIPFTKPDDICSFCKKPKADTKQFFSGNNGAFICGECVILCKARISQ
jgi:hypothetical protein